MAWTKSPQSLIDLFETSVPSGTSVSRRKMFGYPAAFANGNLFIGLHQNDFIIRLSDKDRARFSAEFGERRFEPMPGRPMREYVRLPDELLADPWSTEPPDETADMGGFGNGREISKGGTRDLPLGPDSITGFTIVNAANLDDAEKMAQGNPYISSIRVYEVRSA